MDEKASMLANIIQQFLDRKTDSISLSKTSAGKYSWDIKLYNEDLLNSERQAGVIEQLKTINKTLREAFPDEPK